ncbi:histidinol dehydrogenase [Candidatus Deianiraea vastatrix]|uniref:Histidinol dehydrogenase n=1 Tax=Candidatus Deianiraea vastatrix TaxID=2163644 RepID=A0A5B8XHS0_9RICK|nr:histidinol dehydrogenase [Candidatus Deianiraea vastatrix]QED23611.1 Histidinol dehydrogenase [Candidatus Deianiraea vastatrix]
MTIEKIVQNIQNLCKNGGQDALLSLTKDLDGVALNSLALNVPNNIQIDEKLAHAIQIAKENIYKFHKAEYNKLADFQNDKIETSTGITCFKKFTPIENVGLYVPNKLLSSVLMNVIPAQIAGCKNITICTPPNPSNEILWTLNLLGIDKIYTIGGAQAIFAMAYQIGEIPKADKIFGPGNEFVDMAKRMVSNEVAIDMPAGPSEVLVIADDNASLNAIIFDLLAQLEHGKESRAWLLSTSLNTISLVKSTIQNIAKTSPRYSVLEKSLDNLVIEKVENVPDAIAKSNKIAPEHLILNVENADKFTPLIQNAGSVFLGKYTPESLGDYLSGTNHVLPTSGFAKSFSGLSVLSFGKFITFQMATENALKNIADSVKLMANAETLDFHARSVIRD